MKNIILIATIFVFNVNSFAQNAVHIKNCLDSISTILQRMPKASGFTNLKEYKLKYSEDLSNITLTVVHYEKTSGKKKPDGSVYTFNLSDLDPNFVILHQFPYDENFHIQLFTIDNKSKIKAEAVDNGEVRITNLQDRVTIGNWQNVFLDEGETIVSLFVSAINESLGDKANLPTTTNTEKMADLVFMNKDGNSETLNLDVVEEEPKQDEKVFMFVGVDTPPSFRGSKDQQQAKEKVDQYIKERIEEDKPKRSGTVYVNFTIDRSGKITDIKVLRGVNKELDQLAVKYLEQMEDWVPGVHQGENVLVAFTTGIKF